MNLQARGDQDEAAALSRAFFAFKPAVFCWLKVFSQVPQSEWRLVVCLCCARGVESLEK